MIINLMGHSSNSSIVSDKIEVTSVDVATGKTVYNTSNEPVIGTMPFVYNSETDDDTIYNITSDDINVLMPDESLKKIHIGNNTVIPDSYTWGLSTLSTGITAYSICYGKDKFIAVKSTNDTYYSYNGIDWIKNTIDDTYTKPRSVCYGGDKFVGITNGTSSTLLSCYSEDGINWSSIELPQNTSWNSVCYGNGMYVAVAGSNGYVMYSNDGISWTLATMPNTKAWQSVCYGNDKFVAVAQSSNYAAYSTDGINWVQTTMPKSAAWFRICYGKDKFVAITTTTVGAYSTDGINWVQTALPSLSYNWYSLCYVKGLYVTLKYTDTTTSSTDSDGNTTTTNNLTNGMAYSTDGITWTKCTSLPTAAQYRCMCYGDNKFVAISNLSNRIAYTNELIGITFEDV